MSREELVAIIISVCFVVGLVVIAVGAVLELKKNTVGTLECGYIKTDHGYQPMVMPKFYYPFDEFKHIKEGYFKIEFRDEIPAEELLYYKKATIVNIEDGYEDLTKGGEDEQV